MLQEITARDRAIVTGYRAGKTLKELGTSHDLTSERVRQILDSCGEATRAPGRRPGPYRRRRPPRTAQERFFNKLSFVTEDGKVHWIWNRTSGPGYGTFRVAGALHYAHRAAFFLIKGRWPDRLSSLCGHKACVNPECWEESTAA